MFTSWSEVSTPAELSIASVFSARRPAPPRCAALGEAQVAALGDHLAAQLAAVDAHRVVGAVAHVGMRLGRGLHIGADAAVVEKVHRRLQDRGDQLRGRQLLGVDAEHRARCGDSGTDFSERAQTPPPSEISLVS